MPLLAHPSIDPLDPDSIAVPVPRVADDSSARSRLPSANLLPIYFSISLALSSLSLSRSTCFDTEGQFRRKQSPCKPCFPNDSNLLCVVRAKNAERFGARTNETVKERGGEREIQLRSRERAFRSFVRPNRVPRVAVDQHCPAKHSMMRRRGSISSIPVATIRQGMGFD